MNDTISYIKNNDKDKLFDIDIKDKYTSVEINEIITNIHNFIDQYNSQFVYNVIDKANNNKRNDLVQIICEINSIIKMYSLKYPRISHSGKKYLILKLLFQILFKLIKKILLFSNTFINIFIYLKSISIKLTMILKLSTLKKTIFAII